MEPLRMKDIGFHLRAAKLGWLASCYWKNPETRAIEPGMGNIVLNF
jgi:hypothetical protein